jgi:hypothetical protein
MSCVDPALEIEVRVLLQRESRRLTWGGMEPREPLWASIPGLPGQLAEMAGRCWDRSPRQLAPLVRRMLLEPRFCDDNGDKVVDDDLCRHVEDEVAIVLSVLELLRSRRTTDGMGGHLDAAIPMYG